MYTVLVSIGNDKFKAATTESFKSYEAALSWIYKQPAAVYYIAEVVTAL